MDSVEKVFAQADNVDDILAHFGVKGMRWGVRKRKAQQQHQNGPKSDQAAKVADIIKNIQKNGIGAATNDDLKMLEQRIKLETKYKELFPPKKSLTRRGLEVTERILWDVGEKQANAFLTKQVGGFVTRSPLVGAPKKSVANPTAKPASKTPALDLVDKMLKNNGNKSVSSLTSDVNFGYM